MKTEFEQATLQFQAVYVKDNYQQVDYVWNDTNWLNGSTFVYHVPYQGERGIIQLSSKLWFWKILEGWA